MQSSTSLDRDELMPPPPPPSRPARLARGGEHRELHAYLRQLVRRRPRELMLALVDYDDVALEAWLAAALPAPPPNFVRDWLEKLGEMRPRLLRESLLELETFRRQRHYFDGRLEEALDLLRGGGGGVAAARPSTDDDDDDAAAVL
jgi:hypothetical protein